MYIFCGSILFILPIYRFVNGFNYIFPGVSFHIVLLRKLAMSQNDEKGRRKIATGRKIQTKLSLRQKVFYSERQIRQQTTLEKKTKKIEKGSELFRSFDETQQLDSQVLCVPLEPKSLGPRQPCRALKKNSPWPRVLF